jgi:hypothetical protein
MMSVDAPARQIFEREYSPDLSPPNAPRRSERPWVRVGVDAAPATVPGRTVRL